MLRHQSRTSTRCKRWQFYRKPIQLYRAAIDDHVNETSYSRRFSCSRAGGPFDLYAGDVAESMAALSHDDVLHRRAERLKQWFELQLLLSLSRAGRDSAHL